MRIKRLLVRVGLLTFCSITLMCSVVVAQYMAIQPLLGYGSSDQYYQTHHYGLRYTTQGLDRASRKPQWDGYNKYVMQITPHFFQRSGAAHLIEPFWDEAKPFVADKKYIPRGIDTSFQETRDKWLSCGGIYADIASTTDLSNVVIIFEPLPFLVGSTWAVGDVEEGYRIRIVALAADRIYSDPAHASLRLWQNLIKWEVGNLFMIRGHLWDGTLDGEVGDRSPCEFFKNKMQRISTTETDLLQDTMIDPYTW